MASAYSLFVEYFSFFAGDWHTDCWFFLSLFVTKNKPYQIPIELVEINKKNAPLLDDRWCVSECV